MESIELHSDARDGATARPDTKKENMSKLCSAIKPFFHLSCSSPAGAALRSATYSCNQLGILYSRCCSTYGSRTAGDEKWDALVLVQCRGQTKSSRQLSV